MLLVKIGEGRTYCQYPGRWCDKTANLAAKNYNKLSLPRHLGTILFKYRKWNNLFTHDQEDTESFKFDFGHTPYCKIYLIFNAGWVLQNDIKVIL